MSIIISVLIFAFELSDVKLRRSRFLLSYDEREREIFVTLANDSITGYRRTLRREAFTNGRESTTFAALSQFSQLRCVALRYSLMKRLMLRMQRTDVVACECKMSQKSYAFSSWKYRKLK